MSDCEELGIKPEVAEEILKFRDEREWKPFHNPKDLAISISLEAAELLEIFQWSADDLEVKEKRQAMSEELADVLIYAVMLADRSGLNLNEIITAKMKKNAERYPADQAKGLKAKYTELKKLAREREAKES